MAMPANHFHAKATNYAISLSLQADPDGTCFYSYKYAIFLLQEFPLYELASTSAMRDFITLVPH